MIKTIDLQEPARLTIVKNGNVVADIYVNGIKCGIDTDEINMKVYEDGINTLYGRKLIKLEV